MGPFGPLWNVYKPAMFGHFWSKMDIFGRFPVMNDGLQSKIKVHQQISYACKIPKHPVWNIKMAAIDEKCQKQVQIT